ncbi:MAG TPA: aminodeoxychorismate/anthranilate synthase component II [Saprospiraceae bacterium]|nr:aminodeoxychorismate/anthranilate synthase component II [Saprospiraceae bacterium]
MSQENKKTVIIDNYDSFTYNLVHIINDILQTEVDVIRNDEFELEDLEKYEYIILSPGPGIPDEAGLLKKTIAHYGGKTKIFGVCLGLQAIGEVYGAKLKNLSRVFHGMKTQMHLTNFKSPIFDQIPDNFLAGRYHSWVVDTKSDVSAFDITAVDDEGEIMAMQHKEFPIYAVQFHPESIMTEHGVTMLENFFKL